jgi:hypothetical protein
VSLEGLGAVNHVIRFKRLLLLFWAVWFTIVCLSNVADATKGLGLLDGSWAFASGNWQAVKDATARYAVAEWLNAVLFAGVILWEGAAAVLFWQAGLTFQGRSSRGKAAYRAATIAILLWCAFLVADEVFIIYALAGTHMRLLVATLATLIAIELLPEQ